MGAGTDPQSDEQLRYPTDHVLAIFGSAAKLQEATAALEAAGHPAGDTTALVGPGDVHHLDAAAGNQGLLGRIFAGSINLGDDASQAIAHYREALTAGGAVLAVASKGDDSQPLAQTLSAHGGSFIYRYGRFTVERLS